MEIVTQFIQPNPGDTVVVKVGHQLDAAQHNAIHTRMTVLFPNNPVVVIGSNASIEVKETDRGNALDVACRLVGEFYDGVAEKDWPAWADEAVTTLERLK